MQNKLIGDRLQKQAALLAQLRNSGGFTLTELLIVVIISGIIVSALLGLVVQLVGTEQRESVRTETQREMQLALNYIAADLRQAVYIYEGTPHPENANSEPSYIQYIPDNLQDENNYRPVLAFWKTKRIDDRDLIGVLPDFNPATTGSDGCLSFGLTDRGVPNAQSNECNNLWLKRQNYSLVTYFQAVNNAATNPNGRWDGRSRIVRYELDKYRNDGIRTLARNPGYVDPAEVGSGGFTNWPFGPASADGRGGIVNCQEQNCGTQVAAGDPVGNPQTLVDFVDFIDGNTPAEQAALRNSEPDNCGALNIPGDTANPNSGDSVTNATGFTNYYMLPRRDANNNPKPAFFICLKNTADPAQPGNPRVGQIQDTAIFIRGNANGRGGTGTDSFLPTLQTRVTMRGVIDRVIR